MTKYFSVRGDSFDWRGTPWADDVVFGVSRDTCPACERPARRYAPDRRIGITLDHRKGSFWPDVMGSAFSLFIWSDRAVAAWNSRGWPALPLGEIEIVGNVSAKLRKASAPQYFWIDGAELVRVKLDYEKSGFVQPEVCSTCGGLNYDVSATYDRQRSSPPPQFTFEVPPPSDWVLFTASMSEYMFFCTDALVNLAREFELTNFRFVPLGYGVAYAKKAPPYLPKPKKK